MPRQLTLVVLLIAGLTACSRGPAAARTLPPAPTTASHSPAAPLDRSPRMNQRGAARAVRRYYADLNHLSSHMTAAPIESLFTARCPCRAQVAAIRRAVRRGEHYIDHATLNAIRPTLEAGRRATVFVDLDAARGGLRRADGSVVTSAPPNQHVRRLFHLVWAGGQWRIDRIDAIR